MNPFDKNKNSCNQTTKISCKVSFLSHNRPGLSYKYVENMLNAGNSNKVW